MTTKILPCPNHGREHLSFEQTWVVVETPEGFEISESGVEITNTAPDDSDYITTIENAVYCSYYDPARTPLQEGSRCTHRQRVPDALVTITDPG